MEEIDIFHKDIQDGRYDGKPVLIDDVQNLENDALRTKLKLDKKSTGVLVRRIALHQGPYPLQAGDIVTRIGEHPIDNAGMVQIEGGHHLRFQYMVQRLVRAYTVAITIRRDGKEQTLDIPVGPERNRWLLPYLIDSSPSYFIYGPLVFTEASDEFVSSLAYGGGSTPRIMGSLYA